jgi:hypothetical protein
LNPALYFKAFYKSYLVLGAMGQILSWFWTAGTKAEELVGQRAELFQRFVSFGSMTVIYSTTGVSNEANTTGSSTNGASSSGINGGDNDVNSSGDNSQRKVTGVKKAPAFYSDNNCFK